MAIVNIDNLHVLGVNKDMPNHKLPPEALTVARNVRFFDGAVHKIAGEASMFGTLTIEPWTLLRWRVGASTKYIYANASAIYLHDGATETDITRTVGGAYAAGSSPIWTGGVFQGIPILNNNAFADVPQSWDGTSDMQNLPNWPASTYAKIVRPWNEFIVAAHMQESAVELPYKLRWSTAAVPGSVPSTWIAGATNYAGSTPKLAATGDYIVDMLPLGRVNMVYKEEHVWRMQYVGLPGIFAFEQQFDDFGLLSIDCAVAFRGQHLCVSKGDIIVHNGQSANSIASRRVKRNIFNVMDRTNYAKTHAVLNEPFNEIWIFYPETGETHPNIAAIWNYESDTWAFREVENVRAASPGLDISAASSSTFDSLTGTFDEQVGIFDQLPYNPSEQQLILADTSGKRVLRADTTNQFAGTNFTSTIERTSLPLAGQDRQGNPQINMNSFKMFNRIRPKMTGNGSVVTWRFGTQDQIDGAVTWDDPVSYTIGSDDFIDFDRSGKMLCYQCYDTANQTWGLTGLEVDMRVISHYG